MELKFRALKKFNIIDIYFHEINKKINTVFELAKVKF